MSVQEIEVAISQLKPEEFNQLENWLAEYKSEQWDKQIEADAKAGRLDKLINQAKEDYKNGLARPL
jgi:response regulator of citrate/malate metabolism